MQQGRDLKADLEICNKATPGPWKCRGEDCDGINTAYYPENKIRTEGYGCDNTFIADLNDDEYHIYSSLQEQIANAEFIAQAREGWPEAIERAIKAEAEVERLRLMVKSITGGLDEAIETVHYLEAEQALLRKVASIAWNVVETRGMSDVLLSELAGRLADWETWKEGAE